MNIKDSLSSAFFFLNKLYRDYIKSNESFRYMLESYFPNAIDMYHHLTSPRKSANRVPAYVDEYDRWFNVYKISKVREDSTDSKEIFNVMLTYLKLYEDKFIIKIGDIITLLEDMLIYPEKHTELWSSWEYYLREAKDFKIVPQEISEAKYIADNYLNILSLENETPLHIYAIRGDVASAESMLEKINAKDNNFWTPLYWAIIFGGIGMVKYLVEHGAHINIQDKNKMTPLHIAFYYQELEIANYLIEKEADTNIRNNEGQSPKDIDDKRKSILEQGRKHIERVGEDKGIDYKYDKRFKRLYISEDENGDYELTIKHLPVFQTEVIFDNLKLNPSEVESYLNKRGLDIDVLNTLNNKG